MKGKNWNEFEKYKHKLQNTYDKFCIRWQKSFVQE